MKTIRTIKQIEVAKISLQAHFTFIQLLSDTVFSPLAYI